MNTLARRIGETLVLRGAAAAVARWGWMRVVGAVGIVALIGYFLRSKSDQALLLSAPDSAARGASPGWPDEDRRRTPDLEPGMTYPGERRTLH
ncbi:hypothetical protein LJR289_004986 [Pseudoduganella sp. LjRoot289]|uniref:hypothetical protein n=1 Tax=Pseudoduganella sp. LjRoot289 TaxID=3342314 RepID=UPI003ECF9BCE